MISSLRSRLWLSYAFIVVTALSVVTIVLFVSLFQNPLLYRQTTERLKAVQSVITERSKEDQSPPLSTLAERSARTFNVRVILLSKNREVTFDSASNGEAALAFPENRRVLRTLPIVRDENGSAWLYSIEKLPDGSFLMVTTPRPRISILNIVSDDFMPIIWSGGIIALLLSLVVAFLISGWIANPLQRVVNAARGNAFGGGKAC
ncbi:MAG: hypothetical protein IPJ47_03040 [Anaerolineales bacterium]|nr:hypothetical protein [Anaerolineales bacterium]